MAGAVLGVAVGTPGAHAMALVDKDGTVLEGQRVAVAEEQIQVVVDIRSLDSGSLADTWAGGSP